MASAPQIIGHKKQLLQLAQDLESGNLSHAYLFTGPAHIGKTAVARWFARQILCGDAPIETADLTATQIDRLIHPDFLMLDQLWMEEKMEDWDIIAKSSNIPQQHRSKKPAMKTDTIAIDDVREIQQRLYETGDLAHRVCLIRGIERMQDAAANAFLKILEEPPPGRIFVLTADNPSTVLSTILSRSRVLRFERTGDRDILQMLSDMDSHDASFIAHVAEGAPGFAKRLQVDPDMLRAERLMHTQAIAFWEAKVLHEKLSYLKPLGERGGESDRFLYHLALALRAKPNAVHGQERALQKLVSSLDTNAQRGLQVQDFAMTI